MHDLCLINDELEELVHKRKHEYEVEVEVKLIVLSENFQLHGLD